MLGISYVFFRRMPAWYPLIFIPSALRIPFSTHSSKFPDENFQLKVSKIGKEAGRET